MADERTRLGYRMRLKWGLIGLLALASLLPVQAAQQNNGADQPEELTWYDVEIIIFRHHDLQGASKENWPGNPGEPDFASATRLLPALPRRLSAAHSARLKKPLAFTRLRDDELRMKDKLETLVKVKGYEPLLHIGWRQPGYDREDAKAVHIGGGYRLEIDGRQENAKDEQKDKPGESAYYDERLEGPPPPIINGTIKLIRTRFLHLETDLIYHNTLADDKGELQLPSRNFRMQTSRRMRSSEIHYIDHPMFGILVLITPYEDPDEAKSGDKP